MTADEESQVGPDWRLEAMPLVPVALSFALGLGLSPVVRAGPLWLAGILAVLLLGTVGFLWRDRKGWAAVSLLSSVVVLGLLSGLGHPLPYDHLRHITLPPVVTLEARIVREP